MLKDLSREAPVQRMSVAQGRLRLLGTRPALEADLAGAAKAAAVQAAKDAARILPTVHAVHVTDAFCDLTEEPDGWTATVTVRAYARATLEASALAGVAAALLTLWETVKGHSPRIEELRLVQNVA